MPKTKIGDYVAELNRPTIPEFNPIADLFQRYMRAYKLTGRALAKQFGCTAANVSYKLNRPAQLWTVGELQEYCKLLNCPYDAALDALRKAGPK